MAWAWGLGCNLVSSTHGQGYSCHPSMFASFQLDIQPVSIDSSFDQEGGWSELLATSLPSLQIQQLGQWPLGNPSGGRAWECSCIYLHWQLMQPKLGCNRSFSSSSFMAILLTCLRQGKHMYLLSYSAGSNMKQQNEALIRIHSEQRRMRIIGLDLGSITFSV